MLRRTRSHQLCGGARSYPSRGEAHAGCGAAPVRPLSLPAFPQGASALAEAIPGFRARGRQRRATGRMHRRALHTGTREGLVRQPWPCRQLRSDLYRSDSLPPSMVRLTIAPGVYLWREKFSPTQQKLLLGDVMEQLKAAPLYRPVMPVSAKPFSVKESNFGPLGWVSDQTGYRYQPTHPATGLPWPAIPSAL